MRLLTFAALAVMFLVDLPSAAAFEMTELAARARPSVVLLTVHDRSNHPVATGTGFFVSKDGRLVTNQHVIDGATKVVATLTDGREVEAKGILAEDATSDIAVILFPGDDYVPLALGESRTLRPGEEIVVLGSPNGLSASLSLGIVSAIREKGVRGLGSADSPRIGSSWAIQITAAVSHGSSGSPVMTRDGQVVGVAVGIMATGQNLNFAVPVEVAKKTLDELGPKPTLKPFTPSNPLMRNLALSAGILGVLSLVFFLAIYFAARKAKPKPRPVIH